MRHSTVIFATLALGLVPITLAAPIIGETNLEARSLDASPMENVRRDLNDRLVAREGSSTPDITSMLSQASNMYNVYKQFTGKGQTEHASATPLLRRDTNDELFKRDIGIHSLDGLL